MGQAKIPAVPPKFVKIRTHRVLSYTDTITVALRRPY